MSHVSPNPATGPHPAQRFVHDEDGAMTILGLMIFVMMVLAGGIAIDLMRSEADRARLQSTVDRAALAAASVAEVDEASEIVKNYERASGVPEGTIQVDETGTSDDSDGSKGVSLVADSTVDSLFMGLLGQDQLTQPIRASAKHEYSELEVSLVLDISGSMGRNGKLNSLKVEAKKFLEKLLENENRKGLTTVSIVPYHGLLNVGTQMAGYLPLSNEHDFSRCITFEADDFETTGLVAGTVLQRLPHFDRQSRNWNAGTKEEPDWRDHRDNPGSLAAPHCPTNERGAIIAWSNDLTELNAAIDGLSANGWTATDLGAKVGAMLLDPSTQPILERMADDGLVEERFRGRPAPWDTPNLNKVLVIMTDGANTSQYSLDDDKMDGPSGFFVYRMPDPENPDEDPLTLVPDGVISVDDDGNVVRDCDPRMTRVDIDGDGTFEDVEVNHQNCEGLRGRFEANPQPDPEDVSPWWHANRTDDVLAKIDVGHDSEVRSRFRYSVLSRSSGQAGFYYWPSDGQYHSTPEGGGAAFELTYRELFAAFPLRYISDVLLRADDGSGYADNKTRNHYKYADNRTHHDTDGTPPKADVNLLALCEAAATEGRIEIFTIAFDVAENSHPENIMKGCAAVANNDPGNFQRADNGGLGAAFDDILAAIDDLRLTR
ncbi:MAG: pilus assembly protein TadG-related protein [Pseudomonadota bacterium]